MPPEGFEHKMPASERPQTHALDRTATEIGCGLDTSFTRRVPVMLHVPVRIDSYGAEL
jgi:hypothetical protein